MSVAGFDKDFERQRIGTQTARQVEAIVCTMVQEFAMRGPFVVRMSVQYNPIGATTINTVAGPCKIETVLNGARCFEVREEKER
jgi:hypothetical protein